MGFFVPEPAKRAGPLPPLVGPIVRLGVCDTTTWRAAVLAIAQHTDVEFIWRSSTTEETLQRPEIILEVEGWHFLRFNLSVPVAAETQYVQYRLKDRKQLSNNVCHGNVPIAGKGEEWNVVAYSCYDQRRAIGEVLWRDIAERAASGHRPVHIILGGGDQLYNDNLWNEPGMDAWLKLSKEDQLTYEPDTEVKQQISHFYLYSYLRHTHFHPAAQLLRSTPQCNTWDDHDIFDGWGSYPPKLQTCPLFASIIREAQRFYLAFQNATTTELAASDGFVVVNPDEPGGLHSVHFISQLGPSLAVLAPDSRSQRSRTHILTKACKEVLAIAMRRLPETTRHAILLSAIPMVYPSLGVVEKLLNFFAGKLPTNLLFKTGLYDKIYNRFREPDLLDDVTDHWSSKAHSQEKAEFLTLMRDVARERCFRWTIVSGDVHLCAVTHLRSTGTAGKIHALDPAFMAQIVTSAIGNKPPGDMVVKYIHTSMRPGARVTSELQEDIFKFFDPAKTPAESKSFNNRQNFAELCVKHDTGIAGAPSLHFQLVILGGDPIDGDSIGDRRGAAIPPLLPPGTSAAKGGSLQMEIDIVEKKASFLKLACCAMCGRA